MTIKKLFLASAALLFGLATIAAADIVLECKFEEPYKYSGAGGKDQMPVNCVNNYGWGKKNIDLKIVKEENGDPVQLIDIKSLSSGALQFFISDFRVWNAKYYRVSFRLKAEGMSGEIQANIRRIAGPPWNTYVKGIEFYPTDQWQTYTFTGKCGKDGDSNLGVLLQTGSTGKIWLDNVTVEQFDHNPDAEVLKREAVTGNLLPRSSFEGEADYLWSSGVYGAFPADSQIYRTKGGKFGTYCMAFPSTSTGPLGTVFVRSIHIPVASGKTYTWSFWAKNNQDKARISAIVYKANTQQSIVRSEFVVGGGWKKQSLTMMIPEGVSDVFLGLSVSPKNGVTFLDGFNFELGETVSDYKPAFPYELYLSTGQKGGNLFVWGESIPLTLYCGTADKADPSGRSIATTLKVTLYPDRVIEERRVELHPDQNLEIPLNPRYNGLFRIELIPDDKKLAAPQELLAAILPEPRNTGADSFFGTHLALRPFFMRYAKSIGFKWIRLHDAAPFTKWGYVEPKEGRYLWPDTEIDIAKKNGFFILGLPDGMQELPQWASGSHSTPGNVLNLDAFEKYCTKLAAHYKDRIDYWEVWNEPWMKYFFNGTSKQFADVFIAGARGIKKGNPDAKILGVCAEGSGTKYVAALKPEIWPYVDIFSLHIYFQNICGNGELTFADEIKAFQDTIGPQMPKEVWNTEGAFVDGGKNSFYRFLNVPPQLNENSVAFASRVWVEHAKSGIGKLFIYTIHQTDTIMYYGGYNQMIGFDRSITPGAVSTAVCAWAIDGLKIKPYPEGNGFKQAFFEGADRQTWVIYDDQAVPGMRTLDLNLLPADYRILDTMGNDPRNTGKQQIEVGMKPLFVIGSAKDVAFVANCTKSIIQN